MCFFFFETFSIESLKRVAVNGSIYNIDVFFPNSVAAYRSPFFIIKNSLERKRNAISIANFIVAFLDCNPPNVCKKKSRISSFLIPGFVTITLRMCVLRDLSSVIFDSIGSGSPFM